MRSIDKFKCQFHNKYTWVKCIPLNSIGIMSADEISALVEHQKKVQSPKKTEQQDFQLFGIGLNVYV